jgi:hypothetical protein
MVESPQLYFEVPENILEFIYSVHTGTLSHFFVIVLTKQKGKT